MYPISVIVSFGLSRRTGANLTEGRPRLCVVTEIDRIGPAPQRRCLCRQVNVEFQLSHARVRFSRPSRRRPNSVSGRKTLPYAF